MGLLVWHSAPRWYEASRHGRIATATADISPLGLIASRLFLCGVALTVRFHFQVPRPDMRPNPWPTLPRKRVLSILPEGKKEESDVGNTHPNLAPLGK